MGCSQEKTVTICSSSIIWMQAPQIINRITLNDDVVSVQGELISFTTIYSKLKRNNVPLLYIGVCQFSFSLSLRVLCSFQVVKVTWGGMQYYCKVTICHCNTTFILFFLQRHYISQKLNSVWVGNSIRGH